MAKVVVASAATATQAQMTAACAATRPTPVATAAAATVWVISAVVSVAAEAPLQVILNIVRATLAVAAVMVASVTAAIFGWSPHVLLVRLACAPQLSDSPWSK